MMHILVAPNAFKHSLNAGEVASVISEGLLQSKLHCTSECFPVGDGGDGTGDLIVKRKGGTYVHTTVKDPLGRNIHAVFGIIDGGTAVIEMARASGLHLLTRDELNPLRATSFGTGEQIKLALDKGVNKIIIALGGSATVDGACGMLQALGARFLDAANNEILNIPEGLIELAAIDLSAFDKRVYDVEFIVMCDVDNKLLGDHGAAAVFGPQKGASAKDVITLDRALAKYASVVSRQTGIDITTVTYGGAAGGAAGGLHALFKATLVNGINYFLEATGFTESLKFADLVITGEGSIDQQTLQGKAPYGVAKKAKERNLPVIALAGRVPAVVDEKLQAYFDIILPIGNEPSDLPTALKNTRENLYRTSRLIGDMWCLKLNYQKIKTVL